MLHAGAGPDHRCLTAADALAKLLAGNERFVSGTRTYPNQDARRRCVLAHGQAPFAVIFGCSDSRLAAEIIFDRGLGDLFVVRTAGHAIGPEVLGSIEYAVTILNTPLVVVLGHQNCGAIQTAWDMVSRGTPQSGQLRAVVDAILPSIRWAKNQGIHEVDRIADVHVRRTVDQLLRESAPAAAAGSAVVGMLYDLPTGRARVIAGSALPAPVGRPRRV